MTKPHWVLLSILIAATAFIGREWRSSVHYLSGDLLSSLDSQAQFRGPFKLEQIGLSWEPDGDTNFLVTGKRDGYDSWGNSLGVLNQTDRKLLGSANIQTLKRLSRQFRLNGIYAMVKDSNVTIFTTSDGSDYLRWHGGNNATFSKHAEDALKKPLRGTAGGGWLIYR